MVARYLFVGPSLVDATRQASGSDVVVLPPVAAGDLLRLPLAAGDVVGIVDGFFHQVGAVRHKEILFLLEQGVRVLGAASMGALRAAELDVFGMEGIGRIYADYRCGALTADDEVALLHSTKDEDYRPLSEPLVSMRATLDGAVRDGVCEAAAAAGLIDAMAARPFGLRTYDALCTIGAEMGLDPSILRALRDHCRDHRVDLKRDDALLLLEQLRSADAPPATRPTLSVNRTTFLHAWQLGALGTGNDSSHVPDLGILRALQLFAADYPHFHRGMVLAAIARECATRCGVVTADNPLTAAVLHGEHCGFYKLPADPSRLGFLSQWLTAAEHGTLTLDEQLAVFLVRSFRTTPGTMGDELAMDTLRGTPAWARARRVVETAWTMNELTFARHPGRDLETLSPQRIGEQFASAWAVDGDELALAALDRGIEPDGLVAAARFLYLLARYNPAATRLVIDTEENL
ncbi:hypothetical protein ALI144C_06585 [Actinosynnema sp. ALI-1.44]|uniref:TfuA-like protein n=1 Tax=Actinosynnema sp. ALI-1.44 TaxID=1933779 RepID=UPI00097BC607|nr:TfuA-like protein [Actinosynnema sp. ALI-1.44]ONI88680.1 hypothetical protein ALI144C_06585 [Actinosynnema sp. ALI-1.44]